MACLALLCMAGHFLHCNEETSESPEDELIDLLSCHRSDTCIRSNQYVFLCGFVSVKIYILAPALNSIPRKLRAHTHGGEQCQAIPPPAGKRISCQ